MARSPVMHTARTLRAVCILASLFTVGYASGATTPNSPLQTAAPTTVSAQPVISTEKPRWIDLNPAQKFALAPLAGEWDKLGPIRKEKWLKIANKFASMKPDEQARAKTNMEQWVTLTPEQRRTIRENYARAKKIAPNQKSEQWQLYQQLPEEKKKTLANTNATKKQVTNLPSSSQGAQKIIAPIKAPPKTTTTTLPASQPVPQTPVLPTVQPSN